MLVLVTQATAGGNDEYAIGRTESEGHTAPYTAQRRCEPENGGGGDDRAAAGRRVLHIHPHT